MDNQTTRLCLLIAIPCLCNSQLASEDGPLPDIFNILLEEQTQEDQLTPWTPQATSPTMTPDDLQALLGLQPEVRREFRKIRYKALTLAQECDKRIRLSSHEELENIQLKLARLTDWYELETKHEKEFETEAEDDFDQKHTYYKDARIGLKSSLNDLLFEVTINLRESSKLQDQAKTKLEEAKQSLQEHTNQMYKQSFEQTLQNIRTTYDNMSLPKGTPSRKTVSSLQTKLLLVWNKSRNKLASRAPCELNQAQMDLQTLKQETEQKLHSIDLGLLDDLFDRVKQIEQSSSIPQQEHIEQCSKQLCGKWGRQNYMDILYQVSPFLKLDYNQPARVPEDGLIIMTEGQTRMSRRHFGLQRRALKLYEKCNQFLSPEALSAGSPASDYPPYGNAIKFFANHALMLRAFVAPDEIRAAAEEKKAAILAHSSPTHVSPPHVKDTMPNSASADSVISEIRSPTRRTLRDAWILN